MQRFFQPFLGGNLLDRSLRLTTWLVIVCSHTLKTCKPAAGGGLLRGHGVALLPALPGQHFLRPQPGQTPVTCPDPTQAASQLVNP